MVYHRFSFVYYSIFHRIGEFTLILSTYFQTYFLKTAFPVSKGEHDRNVNKENFPLLYLRSNNISVECYEMIFVCAYVHTICNICMCMIVEVLVPTPSDKIHNPHSTCSPSNWNWWLWTSFLSKLEKSNSCKFIDYFKSFFLAASLVFDVSWSICEFDFLHQFEAKAKKTNRKQNTFL